ncbi:MAG: hypothetical protein J5J00_14130 [Deltaproteobacteria bacterium]|nr:hypothetical protein [Deltaproteobacteria bacterium]
MTVEDRFNKKPQIYQAGDSPKLAYKLKLIESANAPLALLVHGRGGNFDVMWTFERCIPAGSNIIAPQANFDDPIEPHSPQGKSWWEVNDPAPLERKVETAAEAVIAFLDAVVRKHTLSPSIIMAIGFSQGAAVISGAMQLRPQLFRAVALLCGFSPDLKRSRPASLPPVFMAHGTKDDIVPFDKFESSRELLSNLGADIEVSIEDLGHKVGSKSINALKHWLAKNSEASL